MRRPSHVARGVSLIEAVVALAVIAFGMLAYVGLQSSMRFNSDVAKQRAEAVRIAQQAIEEWRAYSFVETTAGQKAYDDLSAGQLVAPLVIVGDNGSFTLQRTVADAAATTDPLLLGAAPRMKTLTVDVSWQDRNGETQTVRLSTTLAASPPELAGTLALPGTISGAQGRHPAIPVGAKVVGQGLSGFKPPGAAGAATVFVFDNATGVIVGVCNGVSTGQDYLTWSDVQNCSNNANALPLSGFVRFFTGSPQQPTAADAENPSSFALGLDVHLALTSTGHPSPAYACYARAPSSMFTTRTVVPYFCAIFFQTGATPRWSGTSTLTPLAFIENPSSPWQVADDTVAPDVLSTHYRVCRYTPAASDSQPIPNQLHPRNYVNVGAGDALTHQNFLIISAGDGISAYQCPTDVAADPAGGDFVNSNTLPHQP